MVCCTSHHPQPWGGTRGHAHPAPQPWSAAQKSATRRACLDEQGQRGPWVCIFKGRLSGRGKRGSEDRPWHELTHKLSCASLMDKWRYFQNATKPPGDYSLREDAQPLNITHTGWNKWVHFLAVAPLLIKLGNSLYPNKKKVLNVYHWHPPSFPQFKSSLRSFCLVLFESKLLAGVGRVEMYKKFYQSQFILIQNI